MPSQTLPIRAMPDLPAAHRRRALAASMAAALLLGACRGGSPEAAPASAGGDLQRSVVVDRPLDGRQSMTTPAPTSPPALPSIDPLADAAVFATATADAAAAMAAAGGLAVPTSQPGAAAAGGSVLSLEPLPCGALTLDSAAARPDCAAELLQSGRLEGRELMALVGFDLAGLPAGAELLYAGLELVTADNSFARPASAWRVEAVDLPAPSFSQVLAALPLSSSLIWRVGAAELAPGRRLTLELGAEARDFLARHLAEGRAKLAFRVLVSGGAGGLASWQAKGERGPRLRLAYLDPAAAAAPPDDAGGVIDWQAAPGAPAPSAGP